MVDTPGFAGARVLIAGGSGVLGAEIAKLLSAEGAEIALAGRDAARLEATAEAIGGAPTFLFDIRSREQTHSMVASAAQRLGGLDGLVNAIGVVAFGPLAEMSDQTLDDLMAANLIGPLRMIRSALPHMEGGFVVNITGVVAESPVAGLTTYSASKAGLSAATSALGRELRRDGIRFLDARPPHTETGLANRPIEGSSPRMPEGLRPDAVARTIVAGIKSGARHLGSSDFA